MVYGNPRFFPKLVLSLRPSLYTGLDDFRQKHMIPNNMYIICIIYIYIYIFASLFTRDANLKV